MDEKKLHFDPVRFPHRELTERVIGCFYDVFNELGLLLNFGPKPKMRRLVFANDRKRCRPPISVD